MDKYTTKNLKYASLRKAFISPPGISYPILDGYMQVPSQLVLEPEGYLLQDIMHKMRERRKSLASDIKFMFMTNWRPVGVRHPLPPHDIVKVQGAESVDNSTFTELNNNLIWVIERGHKVGYIRIDSDYSDSGYQDAYKATLKEYYIIIGSKNIYRYRSDSRCNNHEVVVTVKGKAWMTRVMKQIDDNFNASAQALVRNLHEAANTAEEAFSRLKNRALYVESCGTLSDIGVKQIKKNYSKIANSIPLVRNCFTTNVDHPRDILNLLMYMLFKQHEEVSWDSMPSVLDVDYIELINDIVLSTPSEIRKEFIDKLESANTSHIIHREHLNVYENNTTKRAKLHINLLGNVTLFIPWLVKGEMWNTSAMYQVFHFDNMSLLPQSLQDGVDIMQTTGLCEYVQDVGMMFASYDKCADAEFKEEDMAAFGYFEAFSDPRQRVQQEDYGSYFSFDMAFFSNAVEDNLDWFKSLPDGDRG